MTINLEIVREIDFMSVPLANDLGRPNYQGLPVTRGVYIFHIGNLNDNSWLDTEKILYIGETNRQGLQSRIPINYRGKIRPLIDMGMFALNNVYISYCQIEDAEPISAPKLIERALLHAYEERFDALPLCNNE